MKTTEQKIKALIERYEKDMEKMFRDQLTAVAKSDFAKALRLNERWDTLNSTVDDLQRLLK